MLNNFIYSETKGLFLEQLDQKNIPEEAIAFLEDSGEIGNRNHYFGSVGVNNLLTEGKLIGTITANNNPYNIYAPKTYNWSEITGKPTSVDGYGITNAMRTSDNIDTTTMVNAAGYGYNAGGWMGGAGPAFSFGLSHSYKVLLLYPYGPASGLYFKAIYQGEGGEWRRILDSVNYASVLDTRYLQLTGGIISNTSNAPLKIKTDSESAWVGIEYLNNLGEREGSIGVYGGKPIFVPAALDKIWTILHAGNFNSYAPTLTGTGASGTWGIDISGSADSFNPHPTSPNNASVNRFFTGGFQVEGTPATNYATGLTLRNRDLGWDFQLSFDSEARLYTRRRTSSDWQDWKTVAFTDSNVASATKLANNNAYTAWGQTFFENGKPTEIGYGKNLKIAANNGLDWQVGDNLINNVVVGSTGNFLLGNGGAKLGYNTFVDGNYVYLRYGTQHGTGLMLNESGNVGIGTTNPREKLHVNGNILLPNCCSLRGLLANGTTNIEIVTISNYDQVLFGGDANYYDLTTVVKGKHVQLKYGNDALLGFSLNSSGNVTIGDKDYAGTDYKFFVHGRSRISGMLSCIGLNDTCPTLGSKPTGGFIIDAYGLDTYGISQWVENTGQGFIQVGRFDGTATAYALNLQPLGGVVRVGGRLLVNGATDNASYDFSVNGTGYFSGKVQGASGFSTASANGYGFHSESAWYGMTPIMIGENNGVKLAGFGGIEVRIFQDYSMYPTLNAVNDLGTASNCWRSIFASKSVKIGDATLSWDSTSNALKVDKDFYSDGKVSSGGIEIDPATISTQISQLTATIEGLQSTVKLLQDELNSLK